MRVQAVIELIQARLAVIDKTNTYDSEVIKHYASAVYNTSVNKIYRQGANLDDYSRQYKGVTISTEGDTLERYCLLPKEIISLPNRSKGVRRISSMTSTNLQFVPIGYEERQIIDDTLDAVTDMIGYTVQGSRIIFYNIPDAVTSVKLDLIIQFHEYASTDNVKLPFGTDMDFINAVVNYMMGTPPADLVNNNAVNNRTNG